MFSGILGLQQRDVVALGDLPHPRLCAAHGGPRRRAGHAAPLSGGWGGGVEGSGGRVDELSHRTIFRNCLGMRLQIPKRRVGLGPFSSCFVEEGYTSQ